MPDEKRKVRIANKDFYFSTADVENAFADTKPEDWENKAGSAPHNVIVVGREEKPVKAVFRKLPGIEPDFAFNTHSAIRAFRILGFDSRDTRIDSLSKLSLIGTWHDVENDLVAVQESIKSKGGWASWWSFPIYADVQKKLETPFYVYLNAGGGQITCRMLVDQYETSRGVHGIESPWPEVTDDNCLNKTRLSSKKSEIFKTWFKISRLEKLPEVLSIDQDFIVDARFSTRENVLNQNRFGYVYRKPGLESKFWWVNQGENYKYESKGNYIFAPLLDARGVQPGHWASVGKVNQGDIVLHYAKGELQAVSKVATKAIETERPDGKTKGEKGLLLQTKYFSMPTPLPLKDLPQDLRIQEGGPFNVSGGVKQGYLFELSTEFIENIKHLLPMEWLALTDKVLDRLETSSVANEPNINLPLNLILYGPPGTGKTHRLKTRYFDQFTGFQQIKTKAEVAEDLASECSWWELVSMVLLDLGKSKVPQIMNHPLVQAKISRSAGKHLQNTVWGVLQERTKTDCPNVNVAVRFEPKIFYKEADSTWSIDEDLVQDQLSHLKEKLDAFNKFSEQPTDIKRYLFTTFHQSYSYEEFVEGIKPCLAQEGETFSGEVSYEIKSGVFKEIVKRASADPEHPYAIFIDEISRGNVASIFGELITLIEDDKRKNAENELKAILPYSRDEFVVPQNLHIIGTMNTADRSVVALDNALRRRFSFIEMMPAPEVIEQPAGLDVDLRQLLITINGRIERLLDRDHVIGHSYFMRIAVATDPLKELQHVFANKVIPLLQEYFYGDPGKIGMVLGEGFVKVENNGVPFAKGNWDIDGWDERPIFRFVSPEQLSEEDFKNIYAS